MHKNITLHYNFIYVCVIFISAMAIMVSEVILPHNPILWHIAIITGKKLPIG